MDGRLPLKWGRITLLPFRPSRTLISRGAELTFTLKQEFNSGQHALGRFRLAVTDAPRPVSFGLPSEVKAIFAVSADKRTPQQKKKLSDSFKNANPERIKLANALTEARKPLPADPQIKQLQDKLDLAKKPVPLPLKSPVCEGLLN